MKSTGLLLVMLAWMTGANAQPLPDVPKPPPPLDQPPERPGLQIFSEGEMIVFTKSNMVYWTNNVVVIDYPAKPGDPTNILHCRELTATRGIDGKLDTIIAVGDVQMDQGDEHARGQRAVYSNATEQVVLTGGFGDSPLPYLFSPKGRSVGEPIIYNRLDGTIRVLHHKETDIESGVLTPRSVLSTNSPKAPPVNAPKEQPPAQRIQPAPAPTADLPRGGPDPATNRTTTASGSGRTSVRPRGSKGGF